jgi:hypothetical protein
MPSHTTPWQRSSYFASRGWSKVRNNPLNEIEQDRNTVSSVVVVQVGTSTTRFPKQLLVSLPTLKSDPVDTVVDTSNYITRVGLTCASCVIIPQHSYVIPTSFLHHSYIIHTSFLHPSYIIQTSFTHHSYILPLPVPLDDRDQRRRALQWAKGGQRFGKGIRHKFPNGRVGAAEVGRSGGRGDGVQQHAHAHDAVGRRHGTGQPAQPTEKPTTVTVGQGRLKIC